ncbi:hypothetical protein HNQ59_003417 [Chitinivorax tropicus]|uniref:Ice-binding protein C-terminal domain-containing protein n=1 Tax=Chitinivorax tropicus TaxID=714531 RepID=A0A840MUV5_9PROT|nr:PEP-CTERM sorting domain-containing protein [Chitinivorax tropicus]MBB5020103.1 hypothetical protein [Chitinivorax tropicus]
MMNKKKLGLASCAALVMLSAPAWANSPYAEYWHRLEYRLIDTDPNDGQSPTIRDVEDPNRVLAIGVDVPRKVDRYDTKVLGGEAGELSYQGGKVSGYSGTDGTTTTQRVALGEMPFAAGVQSISSFTRHFTLLGAGRLEIMLNYGYKAGNFPKSIYEPAFNFFSSLEVSASAPSPDGATTRRFDAFEIARPGGRIGSFAEGVGSMFVTFENLGSSAMDVFLTDFSRVNVANALWGQPVPEPETYAMMLAGLGIVGFAIQRRRRIMSGMG